MNMQTPTFSKLLALNRFADGKTPMSLHHRPWAPHDPVTDLFEWILS